MIQGSLFRRLIPPLVAAIALLTAVVTWAGTRMMNDALADRARRRAVSLSTVERDGILRLMRAGEHRDLQDVLEQLGRNPDIAVVRILRPDGAVYASSRPLEKGRVIAGHVALGSDSGDLIPGSGGILRRSHGVVHIVRPFENAKECETCHREAGQPMAWLDMDVDVNEHSIGFATFTSLSVALGGLYLLGAMGILVPQLVSVVLRPLKRVTRAMGKVRDGDLTVSVEPGGTREIDTVVTGFNRMVGDLRKAKAVEEEARRLHMERVEQLASVGELAAGLAHEVRNPLSGVKAVVEVLARETNDSSRRHVLVADDEPLARWAVITHRPPLEHLVSCLTCHRAHASGWEHMMRWNEKTTFLTFNGLWPGTDSTSAQPQYARGRSSAETQAAYYDRPVTAFAQYQRSLCNKCHVRD